MAECHPVGFQWVMEAKKRGATVIHVDPRFTRTSAVADMHVPLRAGSDIAFLGGIVNYILENEKWFKEYVLRVHQRGDDPARGFPGHRRAGRRLLRLRPRDRDVRHLLVAVRGRHRTRRGRPARGQPTPSATSRARNAARATRWAATARRCTTRRCSATRRCSTPAACSRCSSGTTRGTRRSWCPRRAASPSTSSCACARAVTANSGRERTTAWVYSVGWTHHSVGVQYIRGSAIIQLLLGNMGRPGGGILALRGHASHPGLDRHPDAVQPAARLPADAQGRRARHPRRLHRDDHQPVAEGILGERAQVHGQSAEVLLGRRGHGRQRLLLRLPARG